MNETLLITLTVAALSGLTVVAYRHPEGYQRLFTFSLPPLVMLVLFITSAQFGSLNYGINAAYDNLQRYPNDPLKDHAFPAQSMHDTWHFLITFYLYFLPGFAYLIFLRFLPQILGLAIGRRNA
jgi:hypothetical protein